MVISTQYYVNGDLQTFKRIEKLIRIFWICGAVRHIFAEFTHCGVLLHMLEVFETGASQKSVLHGWQKVCIADKRIDSTAGAEARDIICAVWSKQICDFVGLKGLIEGANRSKISYR